MEVGPEIARLHGLVKQLEERLAQIETHLAKDNRRRSYWQKGHPDLTDRELDVLILVAQGYADKQIAERIQISERTARWHVSHMLNKLQLNNRVQLARYAWRTGLVNPNEAWETVKSMQWR